MHSTLVTTALGRRGRGALAVTLAAAGVCGALADRAHAAQPPPRCATMACPDLVVYGFSRGSASRPGYAIVENVGGFRARLSTTLSVVRPGPEAFLSVPPLDPGQRYRARLPLCVVPPGHNDDQTWTLSVDDGDLVEESNETNNWTKVTLECEG